jgi:mono/diheme cytochrome c family protein
LKRIFLIVTFIFVMAAFLTGCGGTASSAATEAHAAGHADSMPDRLSDDEHQAEAAGSGMMGDHSMMHAHAEVPAEYADLTNPLIDEATALTVGRTIFETTCAACHGQTGVGDGPAAAALNPKPANLTDGAMMHDLSDGYLYWRISQGGSMAPFNSAMPAWETQLSETEIWQVISYIRSMSR